MKIKSAAMWNAASGMLNAAQSAIILMFITRYINVSTAGIFSIAYAIGNLICTIAKYGVRNFQVTDVKHKYEFGDYFFTRCFTIVISVAALLIYLFWEYVEGMYTTNKIVIIFFVCVWKLIDTTEDVFYGMYQQQGKLDIGAKYYTLRIFFSTIIFCTLIMTTTSLQITVVWSLLLSAIVAACFIVFSFAGFSQKINCFHIRKVTYIIRECFPLCIGTSLAIYVGNIPKYLIDQYMDDTLQAHFSIIFMPAFIIMMLSNFIYQPVVKELGELWETNQTHKFVHRIVNQYFAIFFLTLLTVLAGSIFGLPVLSMIYGIDLSMYRMEFILLLIGGGIYAFGCFIMVPLTTIRCQKVIAYVYFVVALLNGVFGGYFAKNGGMLGVAIIYIILNLIITIVLTASFVRNVKNTVNFFEI